MTRRPNVVIIYADDLGYGDVGCFGSTDVGTPNLDRLAAGGLRLTHWYANSPVCSPSRAALLTGRHPVHAGVQEILGGARGTPGLPPQPTLATHFGRAGYATGIFGKWHLGTDDDYGPLRRGFDTHFGFRAGCVDYYSHIFYWGRPGDPVHDLWQDETEVWDNGRYLTEAIATHAAQFIRDNADRPFVCYVPFNAPHYPMHAPQEYVDRFEGLPPERRIMAAMIAAMDDGIGAIMSALAETGLEEDTIVFFSSDNGPSTESRNWLGGEEISYQGGSTGGLRGNKGSLFDGGIRVPAIISWPGHLPAGQTWAEPAAMMDLLPTLCAACGLTPPPEVDGVDLFGALRTAHTNEAEPGPAVGTDDGALHPLERSLFWEYGPQLAVRRGRWKLTISPREHLGGPFVVPEILTDLVRDPGETTDLRATCPEVAEQLRAELLHWAESFGWDPSPWLD